MAIRVVSGGSAGFDGILSWRGDTLDAGAFEGYGLYDWPEASSQIHNHDSVSGIPAYAPRGVSARAALRYIHLT